MKKMHSSLDRVLGHPPGKNQVLHIVSGGGRVGPINALALAVTHADVGLVIHR